MCVCAGSNSTQTCNRLDEQPAEFQKAEASSNGPRKYLAMIPRWSVLVLDSLTAPLARLDQFMFAAELSFSDKQFDPNRSKSPLLLARDADITSRLTFRLRTVAFSE